MSGSKKAERLDRLDQFSKHRKMATAGTKENAMPAIFTPVAFHIDHSLLAKKEIEGTMKK